MFTYGLTLLCTLAEVRPSEIIGFGIFHTKEALETVIDFECKSIAKIFEIRKFNYISNESKIKIK
jgi:hypothetical protein